MLDACRGKDAGCWMLVRKRHLSIRPASSISRVRGIEHLSQASIQHLVSSIFLMSFSRKCVPFTPFDGELSRSTVALVTAGGVHLQHQEPFNIADELGDLTYRVIPEDVAAAQLQVTHHHYDHRDADEDINVVFPIDVLRDLQAEGFIRGIARKHIGYMGYTMQLKAMYEGTAREIANEIDKGSRADLVVLTGG
jgi:D-proline reductase (dithiol) PrdB